MIISRSKVVLAAAAIKAVESGKFFSVEFVKKDGSVRKMNCRGGVKKYLKGGDSTIKHIDNLVSVFDMQAKQYRCFDVSRLNMVRFGGDEVIAEG